MMRIVRRAALAAAALALPLAVVGFVGVGSASAGSPKYTGPALGKVTCHTVTGKVSLSPPLKTSSGGTAAKFVIKMANCTVSGLPAGTHETITKGQAKGTASEPGTGCNGLANGSTRAIPLTVKWKGTFTNAQFPGTKAKFPVSNVSLKGFVAAFNSAQDAGFEVPNPSTMPNGGSVTGSFPGTITDESTIYSNTNVSTLGSECGAKGIKKLTIVSGTVTLP
jgi:hypothetical protein